jgi:RNA ligase
LDALVADGWLRSQRHPEADLWIYNYTERTQYENYWTPETLACRGLILDAESRVVARPFAKFLNYGTPQAADLPAEPFTVTEKIDGSLGILYYLGGQPCIATRGASLEAGSWEQADDRDREIERPINATILFEIVYYPDALVEFSTHSTRSWIGQ